MSLSREQRERYARHLVLPEMGEEGQEKLGQCRALVVGTGGLGSPVSFYLTAVGIGVLGIVDSDEVELSNLQRQILHGTAELGQRKVDSAAQRLENLNPHVQVQRIHARLDESNAASLIAAYDFVVDATDNFPSRFLIADACQQTGIPYSHAGVLGLEGQTMTVIPGQTACYRCIFRTAPEEGSVPSCQENGLLGTLPGILGTIQATEVVKYFLGMGKLLTNRLLTVDARDFQFRQVPVQRNPRCPLCAEA